MLLSEILFSIKNLKPGGLQDDDMKFSDRQIIFMFEYYRAIWIAREYNKGMSVLQGLDQVIGNNGLVVVDESDEDIIGSGHALDGWLITEKVPKIINLGGTSGLAITYFGSPDGTNPYTRIKKARAHLIQYARYTSDEGFYYPLDDRFAIKPAGGDDTDNIAISAVCANPFVLFEKYTQNLDPDYHFEYPAHSKMMDGIIKMMHESEIKISSIFPTDDVNDSRDTQAVNIAK